MSVTGKELKVRYVGDDSQLRKTISDIVGANESLSSKLQNIGKSMFRTGRVITTGLTLPLAAFGKLAVDEFTQFEHVQAQTEAALKSTGGAANVTAQHIDDLSTRLGRLTAQDNEDVQANENLLLTFKNIANQSGKNNDIFDQTSKAVQDMSAAMGQDGKSSAIQLGKALNDPTVGLTALTRVGVTFTNQQKKQIANLQKHNDLLGAQKIILGEVNSEFGGSAKALGETASPFTKISLAFKDLAQSLGAILVPMLDSLVKWVQKAADWFSNLSPQVKKIIVIAAILAAALGPVILILGAVVTAIGAIISPITLVIIGIAALAFVIVKNWGVIKRVTLAVWGWLKKYIGPVVRFIIAYIKLELRVLIDIWKAAWIVVKSVLQEVWSVIKVLVINRIRDILNALRPWLHLVASIWKAAWNGMKSVFSSIWHGLLAIAKPVLNGIIFLINGVIHAVNALVHGWNLLPGHADIPTIATIPSLGKGGIVMGPTIAMIGERGPEAIVPLSRGGGFATTVNVYIAGSVTTDRAIAEDVRRELVKIARRNGGQLGF